MTFRENKTLLLTIIFVAALLVRLCTMIILETYRFETEAGFGFGYGETARQVALGEGFSLGYFDSGAPRVTAVAPPGYVYFVALVFSIFGIYSIQSAVIIEILQSLTAAFTCVVFYHLGRKYSDTVGLVAALGMAFYPPSILFSVMRISPIVLVVLLLGIIILYLFRIQEHGRTRDSLVCGVLMGVNALMEPTVILFYVASCLWLFFWSAHSRFTAVKSSVIMGTVCILCVLPWTIRNYLVFNAFVPVKSSIGTNLWQGNNPYANGITFLDFESQMERLFTPQEREKLLTLDEVQKNQVMQEKAIGFIKADPKRFAQLTLKRIFYYWSFVNPYWPSRYDAVRVMTYGPLLILAVLGLILAGKKWREASLFLALFLSYPFFYYVTQITIYRYRYAPEAFLIIPASFAVVELIKMFGGMRLRAWSGQQAGKDLSSRRVAR